MTQNLSQNQNSETFTQEPEISDNSEINIQDAKISAADSNENDGQVEASTPSQNLILGKFKSIEDLSKAYEELQKHQGKTSEELGSLRKDLADFNSLKEISEKVCSLKGALIPQIQRDKELYDTPEYLQNGTFKEMYTEALIVYGDNLDTDRMVNLLETYVKERISAYEKEKSAQNETQGVINSMSYSKNPKTSLEKPKKSLSEMTEDEFRESVRKLI